MFCFICLAQSGLSWISKQRIVIEITESLANCLMDDKVLSGKRIRYFQARLYCNYLLNNPRVLDGQKYQAVNKQ